MRGIKRRIAIMLATAGMIAGLGAVGSLPALANESKPACATELNIAIPSSNDAVRAPVLLVHGLWGGEGTWLTGDPSMYESLESISSIALYRFDYEAANDRWVTDPAIGQRLAKTIVCYSKLYERPVVLVAHSMGGLAVREALSWAAYGTKAKDVTGHVITIGTPHEGLLSANLDADFWLTACEAPFGPLASDACREIESTRATAGMRIGSEQLAKLAKFPSNISVKAIAGEVAEHVCIWWTGCSPAISTGGDMFVPVASATAEYTDIGRGDGKTVFKCESDTPLFAWCSHNRLLQAPEVQAEVKESIETYLSVLPRPTPPLALPVPNAASLGNRGTITMFNRLTIPFSQTWDEAMSEPETVVDVVDKVICNGPNAVCPYIEFANLASPKSESYFGKDPLKKWAAEPCTSGPGHKLEGPAELLLGGEPAQFYRQRCGPEDSFTRYAWLVPGKQLFIFSTTGQQGAISPEILQAALERVRWL